jgi:hypothetical protein
MRAITSSRRAWVAGAAAIAGLASAFGPANAQTGDAPQAKSLALRGAPAIGFAAPGRIYDSGAEARRASDAVAGAVPLPKGGNFNGVRWEEAGAGLSDADIHAVQEYNAACQWLRALSDGRDVVNAQAILADVPSWPTLRGTDRAQLWVTAAKEFPNGELAIRALDECRASHEREVAYARGLGLAPSS